MLKGSTQNFSEEELTSFLREGRQEALVVLYDRYAPVLLGIITRITEDNDLSEEVLQESFVKIWNEIQSFDSQKGTLVSWLLSITRELALIASKSKIRNLPFSNDETNKWYTVEANVPGGQQDTAGVQDSFTSFRLPPNKVVFNLIYLKGYSCAEAAKELGMTTEQVKTTFRESVKDLSAGL